MENQVGLNLHARRLDGCLAVLREDLATIVQAGGNMAEVAVNGLDAVIHGRLFRWRLEEVKHTLNGFPLRYTVHAPNCLNLQDMHQPKLQEALFESCLEFTAAIGATHFVYHEGFYEGGACREEQARKREIKLLHRFASHAVEDGIKICVENNRTHVAQVVSLVKDVASEAVGVCCDIAHLFLIVGGDVDVLLRAVDEAAPYVHHVHVHDNFGQGEVATVEPYVEGLPMGIGDLHLPLGWGGIPYQKVFEVMSRWYRDAYILELKPRFFETGLAREALRDLKRMVQASRSNALI